MGDRLHLIIRRDGGAHLYSPQLPQLVAGRETVEELFRDLPDILSFAAPDADLGRAVLEQLDHRGDAAVVAASVADQWLWTTHFAYDDASRQGWHSLDHWGWTLKTSVAEIMASQTLANRPRQVLVSG